MSRVIINSLPFATRFRSSFSAKKLLEHDRKRAGKFLAGVSHHRPIKDSKHPSAAQPKTIDVTDAGVIYTASVGVGDPATQYNLIVDTGSSNTWVGAGKPYKSTETSHYTGGVVNVMYGSGAMMGLEYTDKITLNPQLLIGGQSIGVAAIAEGFEGYDGILGVGPTDLTEGTVSNVKEVPTVTDNLYSNKTISSDVLGVFFDPSTVNAIRGELAFGRIDEAKTIGEVNYVPITSSPPSSQYWGINQSVTYGGATILDSAAGIVDTGTTLLLLDSNAFEAYQKATGATMDQNTGLLTISEDQYKELEPMLFHIGNNTYELTPNAQIWPRALNSIIGGNKNQIYLITGNLGQTLVGSNLGFINGFAWLQRFYSVYDATKSRVGFAETRYTHANTN